jgi:hypothetical protein
MDDVAGIVQMSLPQGTILQQSDFPFSERGINPVRSGHIK